LNAKEKKVVLSLVKAFVESRRERSRGRKTTSLKIELITPELSTNSKSDLGDAFSLFSWFLVTNALGLIGAVLFFLLRVIGVIKHQSNLLYCFFAVLIFCIGLVGLVLYFCVPLNRDGLHVFLLNLWVGVTFLSDIFFLTAIFKKS
jgi:hypothetical protein